MELKINKLSFIDEFKAVRNIENRKAKDRTEGFNYLHNATIKKLAEGGSIEMQEFDFSKFTYEDLEDYLEYYNNNLVGKIEKIKGLFDILKGAETIFSPGKRYY